MYYLLFLLACISINFTLLGQNPSLEKQWEINLKNAQSIQVDKLNNSYIVAKNILYKFDEKGDMAFSFSENSFGRIAHVDISNPLQILLFYENYNKAIILDRTLSEMHRIALQDLKKGNFISAIALSSDNQLWIYDADELLLQKLDKNGKVLRSSQHIALLLEENTFMPQKIYEYMGHIYLYDKDFGILVFDILGNFVRKLEIQAQNLFFYRDYLGYWDKKNGDNLVLYHLQRKNIENFSLPFENFQDMENIILAENELLFSLKKGKISCFLIKK